MARSKSTKRAKRKKAAPEYSSCKAMLVQDLRELLEYLSRWYFNEACKLHHCCQQLQLKVHSAKLERGSDPTSRARVLLGEQTPPQPQVYAGPLTAVGDAIGSINDALGKLESSK